MVAPAAAAEATPAMPAEAMLALALALAERPAEMLAEPMRQPTCSSSSLTHLLKRDRRCRAGWERDLNAHSDQENETATQKAEREAAEACQQAEAATTGANATPLPCRGDRSGWPGRH